MKSNQFAHFWGLIKIVKKFVFQILFWQLFFKETRKVLYLHIFKKMVLTFLKMKTLQCLRCASAPKFAVFFNCTHKNEPDRQHSAPCRKLQKVLYHPTAHCTSVIQCTMQFHSSDLLFLFYCSFPR